MKKKLQKIIKFPEIYLLTITSLGFHLWGLYYPKAVVFDEVYFKSFAGYYLKGQFFFDIHPPLAKLIFAAFAKISGIGADALLNTPAVGLRIVPALAGVIIVPLVWGILRQLGARREFAFIGAFAVVFDNALLVESRFILTDSLLLMFGLAALYAYLIYRKSNSKHRRLLFIFSVTSAGAALSIKWTGFTALLLILMIWAWDFTGSKKEWKRKLIELVLIIIIPAIVYIGSFWIHFALLTRSGTGDTYMNQKFQLTLKGNPIYQPDAKSNFASNFIGLNKEMYSANIRLNSDHPYASHWYSWPLQIRPIYYWTESLSANQRVGNIYLIGNPVIWWGVITAALIGIGYAIYKKINFSQKSIKALSFISAGYLLNFIPFGAIHRPMFLYHYFFAFIFSLLFVCILWDEITNYLFLKKSISKESIWKALLLISIAIVVGFLWFAPLTYGISLSPSQLQWRMWLKSWR